MGNRVRADITIGGRLKACCVPAFLEAVEELSVRDGPPDWGDSPPPQDAAALAGLLARCAETDRTEGDRIPRGLTFGDDEVNYGNLDDVKIFCRARGLAYHYDCADGNGEFDAEDEWWAPDPAAPGGGDGATLYSFCGGGTAITMNEVRGTWKDKTGAQIAAWYDARTVEPGPLTLVEGDACLGCLADALEPGASLPQDFAPAGVP